MAALLGRKESELEHLQEEACALKDLGRHFVSLVRRRRHPGDEKLRQWVDMLEALPRPCKHSILDD